MKGSASSRVVCCLDGVRAPEMALTIGSVISEHAPGSITPSSHLFIGIKGGVKDCLAGVIPVVSFRPQQVHTQPECVPKCVGDYKYIR